MREGLPCVALPQVMLNTCKTTEDAVKLVQQARQAGIMPSDRTCLKLAKMYIKVSSECRMQLDLRAAPDASSMRVCCCIMRRHARIIM
jgi:tRNA(Phe) wybutosine-synthesizing methylase Tyw3